MNVCMSVYVHPYICMYICVCVYINIHTYIHAYIKKGVYGEIYVCIHKKRCIRRDMYAYITHTGVLVRGAGWQVRWMCVYDSRETPPPGGIPIHYVP